MAHVNSFKMKLDRLFKSRTYWLRSAVGSKFPGRPPKINRKTIDLQIEELQDLASTILGRSLAKKEFSNNAKPKRGWQVKGWGYEDKKIQFEKWLENTLPKEQHFVYVFWKKKICVYVGRTGSGGSRPSSHFEKIWFPKVTRIDIHPAKSKRQTPKLECLAIHHFEPAENRYKAARKKWTPACPLCAIHKDIEAELKKIFRMK